MRLLRQRANYWSCTDFANWLRRKLGGVEKPASATLEEWAQYHADAKTKSKFVDWLTSDGLDGLQNFLLFPADVYHAIRIYVVNRFVDRTHMLDTKLTPGQWYDTDTKLLHGMFEALVDYIEVEKARMEILFNFDENAKKAIPAWQRFRWLRWTRKYRDANAGLAYLAWELSLVEDHPSQAKAAAEQLALYNWWKFTRPQRKSIYGEKHSIEQMHALEQQYDEEDEQMMIRLIKVRQSLWT